MKVLSPPPMSGIIIIILFRIVANTSAQSSNHILDSLTNVLNLHPKEDSIRVDILATMSMATKPSDSYRNIAYLNEALRITQKIKNKNQEAGIRIMLGFGQMAVGESIKSIEHFQAILDIDHLPEGTRNLALDFIGLNYKTQGDLDKALEYAIEADKFKTDDPRNTVLCPWNYGDIYYKKNKLDSALKYAKISFQKQSLVPQFVLLQFAPQISSLLGNIYIKLNQKDSALYYIHAALKAASIHTDDLYLSINQPVSEIECLLSLAKWFDQWGSVDSLTSCAIKAYHIAHDIQNYDYMLQSAQLLKSTYLKEKKFELALKYNELAIAAKDSVQGLEKVKKTQSMHYDYQLKEQQLADLKNQLALKSKIRFVSFAGLFALLFSGLLYRMVRQRKKTINILNEQNTLIESQKDQLHQTINDLHEKQTQLIHAEKMASLGELTAGIAHEIQNPLNFVNNFSEINTELIAELEEVSGIESRANSGRDVDIEADLLAVIKQNSKKINHHGKRAESIVRGMLEHSQSRPGIKVEMNINTLAEEYLKLAYHAIRAKNKSLATEETTQAGYNVNLITELDPSIPNLKIIPSDIGRVLINIFNNAFYSMNEKEKKLNSNRDVHPTTSHTLAASDYAPEFSSSQNNTNLEQISLYHPTLIIQSQLKNDQVELIIKDNGLGISKAIQSKIFQPFFTTKPAGNGTGLGLSLSYDIITKLHGGQISVESEEGKYCEIKISLPVRVNG
jgi:two-component system, NtrC family, sensor kinase